MKRLLILLLLTTSTIFADIINLGDYLYYLQNQQIIGFNNNTNYTEHSILAHNTNTFAHGLPSQGVSKLTITNAVITGETYSYYLFATNDYTLSVSPNAGRYIYTLEIVGDKAWKCALSDNLQFSGSWVPGLTNIVIVAPSTGILWNVYGRNVGDIANKVARYPIFELRMDYPYADFEIKATTNNFTGDETTSLVYMYVSSRPHGVAGIPEDDNAYCYFTDDYAADVRKWVLSTNHTSLFTLMADPVNTTVKTVYFMPSLGTNDNSSWMYEGNPNLRWSWVRVGPLQAETNKIGRQIWSPIMPIQWSTSRIAP